MLLLFVCFSAFSQVRISGTVQDNNGDPLPGATILEKNAPNGTTSDFDGNFELRSNAQNPIIVVSYIGFTSEEIAVDKEQKITVQLKLSSESLEEVVVIGYGSSSRSDITASITTVKPVVDDKAGVATVESLLKGVSGMNVISNGEPGAAVSINIRGVSSLSGSNQPLYVIDGIVMDSSSEFLTDPTNFQGASQSGIGGVAPEDIESMQVLKDASATAIYGSLGANGVILITTKQGRLGAPTFNFSTSTTVGQANLTYDILNTDEYVAFTNNRLKADPDAANQDDLYPGTRVPFNLREDGLYDFLARSNDLDPTEADVIGVFEPIDWRSLYRTTYSTNTRLTASGGTDDTKYYSSLGYFSQEGILANVYLKKLDLNLNASHRINKKLKLGGKISASVSENSLPMNNGANAQPTNSIYKNVNDNMPLDARPDLGEIDPDSFLLNPRGMVDHYDNISNEDRVLGNLSLEYRLKKDLIYNLKFGGDYRTGERHVWNGVETNAGIRTNGRYGLSTLKRFSYNVDNTITYRPKAIGNHRYSLLGGVVYNSTNSENSRVRAGEYTLVGQENRGRDFVGAGIVEPIIYNYNIERMLSFLGRATYGYKDRYKVSASLRHDGSSKFVGKKKYGLFPAISAAWEIHKESFIDDANTKINLLKFRIGYGETGNQRVNSNLTFTNYQIAADGYANADKSLGIVYQNTNIANVDLGWETQKQLSTGIDLGMFQNRLSITVDAYNKQSDDLLNRLQVGPSAGRDFVDINQGALNNQGIEVAINGDVFKTKDFTWNLFGTYSVNRIEIQDIGLEESEFGSAGSFKGYYGRNMQLSSTNTTQTNVYLEGEAPGLLFGYQTDGIVTADEVTNDNGLIEGLYKIVDNNGNGTIDADDRTIIGDPNPDFIYSFGTNASYKNWNFNANFYGVVGNDIYNANYI